MGQYVDQSLNGVVIGEEPTPSALPSHAPPMLPDAHGRKMGPGLQTYSHGDACRRGIMPGSTDSSFASSAPFPGSGIRAVSARAWNLPSTEVPIPTTVMAIFWAMSRAFHQVRLGILGVMERADVDG